MRILVIIFLFFGLNAQLVYAAGKGELKLSEETMEAFISYLYGGGNDRSDAKNKRSDPMLFSVSENGMSYNYFFCPYAEGCRDDPGLARRSNLYCEEYSSGSKCHVFAKKRRVIWKNGGPKLKFKKKELKSPFVVAQKIQEAGFYDGDIEKLPGINMKDGKIDRSITILGQKPKTSTSGSNDKSGDLVEQLENLKKLLESGVLTEEEFNNAKTKLLN